MIKNELNKFFLTSLLLSSIFASLSTAAVADGQPTIGEFQRQIRSHIQRVSKLGSILFYRYGGDCTEIVPHRVAQGLFDLHDYNKTHAPGLARRLLAFYGRNPYDLPENEFKEYERARDEVNLRDNHVDFNYLARNGFADQMSKKVSRCGQTMLDMLLIADHIDRVFAVDSRREFATPRILESYRLRGSSKKEIAEYGEHIYYAQFPEQVLSEEPIDCLAIIMSGPSTQAYGESARVHH
jgi:hypothetical protein